VDKELLLSELKRLFLVDSFIIEKLNTSNGRIKSQIVIQERVDLTISKLLLNYFGDVLEVCFLIRLPEERLL